MALLLAQLVLMRALLRNPRERAPWYNATGTSLYVIGMLVSAFALRSDAGLQHEPDTAGLGRHRRGWAWCRPRSARWWCSPPRP